LLHAGPAQHTWEQVMAAVTAAGLFTTGFDDHVSWRRTRVASKTVGPALGASAVRAGTSFEKG
jgi:hypothetical protein